jgi:hypothetical protein
VSDGTSVEANGSRAMSIVELETRVITSCDVRADVGIVVSSRATPLRSTLNPVTRTG